MSDPLSTPAWSDYMQLQIERPDWFSTPKGGVEIVTDPDTIRMVEAQFGDRYAARGQPREWALVGLHYRDPYLMVLRDAVQFPDGSFGVHHRCLRQGTDPSGVAILPFYKNDVVLLRHFRHPTRQWHWEAPRGAIEAGATAFTTIATELSEEIEGVVEHVQPLGKMYGATGFMGLGVLLYAATLGHFGAPALGEGIAEARCFTPAEIDRMIRDGAITDSFTLGCWLHAKLRGLV
jgi:ADP-ribose pyrophosphatase